MATMATHQPQDSDMRDRPPQPASPAPPIDPGSHVNGVSLQQNGNVPDLAPPTSNGVMSKQTDLPATPTSALDPPPSHTDQIDKLPPTSAEILSHAKHDHVTDTPAVATPVPVEAPIQPPEPDSSAAPEQQQQQPEQLTLPVQNAPLPASAAEVQNDASPSDPLPSTDAQEDPLPTDLPSVTHEETSSALPPVESADEVMKDADVASTKLAREREDDDDESAEPAAKRPKTDELMTNGIDSDAPMTSPAPVATSEPLAAPETASATPVPATTSAATAVAAVPAPFVPPAITGDFGPMSEPAAKRMMEGMRNLKKSKSAVAFLKPVDWEALNIPTYPTIVTAPMDLGTMEAKLKASGYASVNEYVADFNMMVKNAITFNGSQHPVAQAAMALQSAFQAQLKKLPPPGEPFVPPPKSRQSSFVTAPIVEKKRRESRPSAGGAQSPTGTFAAPNGVPTIRRDSTAGNRPKREIHKPPPREIPYAKPRKKKFQAELEFCGEVLVELKRQRYDQYLQLFSEPVDPVALNIPHYRKIIKHPMDISTITEKYNNGEYQSAKEFEKDWHLMFNNAARFNGAEHLVTKLAREFENIFNDEMSKKDQWLATRVPNSPPPSDAAESEAESEEESEDEDEARKQQLAQMHAQIAALQAQTASLMAAGSNKKKEKVPKKKEKAAKPGKGPRKSSGAAGVAVKEKKPKAKAGTKTRPITNKEKEEISAKIGELDGAGMGRAAEIIKASLRRSGRHDLADKPDDDLEFDIGDIPDDGLQGLLKLVRELVKPAAATTEMYYPAPRASGGGGGGGSKPRKNRPMNSREQEEAVNRLDQQIAGFDSGAGDNSDIKGESSDDDDDDESGSESEEE